MTSVSDLHTKELVALLDNHYSALDDIKRELTKRLEDGEIVISPKGRRYCCQQKMEIRYIGRQITRTEELDSGN